MKRQKAQRTRRSWIPPHSGELFADEETAPPLLPGLSNDRRLWLTFAAVAIGASALMASIVWQGAQAAAQQRAAIGSFAHAFEVLVEVGRFTTALSETQRGAGGYLLSSGDPAFLARYEAGAEATPVHLRQIQMLTADNPDQQKRLAILAADTALVLELDKREVQLQAAGRRAEAIALVRSKAANSAIQRAGAVTAAIAGEEERLLAARRANAARATLSSTRTTVALAFLGTVLLALAGGLGWAAVTSIARARVAEARSEAHEEQAAAAALLSTFIAAAPAAIAMFDRQMRFLASSRRFTIDYGLAAGTELIGRSYYDIFPEIPAHWRDIQGRVLAGETDGREEDPFPRSDGRIDWVRWRMEPWRDAQGEIGGALLFSEVITGQVEARRGRLAAEARLRAIVETAVDAILVIDEVGVIQTANPATERLFGYSADELLGCNVSILMPEPVRSAHDGFLASYLQTGQRRIIGVGREVDALRKDGSPLPVDLAVTEWRAEGKRFYTGILRDISLRRVAEAQRLQAERRELVVGELRHRINNMSVVIQGLVVATARSHCDVPSFRDALLDRIIAYAATQVELARQAWTHLGMRDLLEFELKPFYEDRKHILLKGEPLFLTGAAAESLAMVVHELATNAAKHGALSAPDATVEVCWRQAQDAAGEPRVIFEWTERGGPVVKPPQRKGFGSNVIASSAKSLGGDAELEYAKQGLRCTINMQAARVLAPDSSPDHAR